MAQIPQIYPRGTIQPAGIPYASDPTGGGRRRDIGSAISNAGEIFAALALKRKQLNDATELSSLSTNLSSKTEEFIRNIQKMPDTEEHEPYFIKNYNKLVADTIKDVKSPEVRANLKIYADRLGERKRLEVIENSYKLFQSQQLAATEDMLTHLNVQATSDIPEEREVAVKQAKEALDMRVNEGVFKPEYAQERYQKWINEVEIANALKDARSDPVNLINNRAKYQNITPMQWENLISKAQQEQREAAQIAFQSERREHESRFKDYQYKAIAGELTNFDMEVLKRQKVFDLDEFEKIQKARYKAERVTDPHVKNIVEDNILTGKITEEEIMYNPNLSAEDTRSLIEKYRKSQEISSRPNYELAKSLIDKEYGGNLFTMPSGDYYRIMEAFNNYITGGMAPLEARTKVLKDFSGAQRVEAYTTPEQVHQAFKNKEITWEQARERAQQILPLLLKEPQNVANK